MYSFRGMHYILPTYHVVLDGGFARRKMSLNKNLNITNLNITNLNITIVLYEYSVLYMRCA